MYWCLQNFLGRTRGQLFSIVKVNYFEKKNIYIKDHKSTGNKNEKFEQTKMLNKLWRKIKAIRLIKLRQTNFSKNLSEIIVVERKVMPNSTEGPKRRAITVL
jgi:hypothetical protein